MSPLAPAKQAPAAPRAARWLEAAALATILAAVAARPMVGETAFRTSQFVMVQAPEGVPYEPPVEAVRVSFSLMLLAAAAMWAAAQAIGGRGLVVGGVFGAAAAAFAAVTLASALGACDVRGALTAWLELAAILAAAFVAMQLARRADRWLLLMAVLAAAAATVALKGISQVALEFPMQVELFEADPEGQLALAGVAPGTPGARMFEKRLRDNAPFGYLSLANLLASLLIVTGSAAAGLMIEKAAFAWADRRRAGPGRRGEVHLPMLAAALSVAPAVLAVVVLAMTRSKGGIAAGVIALAVMVAVVVARRPLSRHRRKALAAAAALLAGGIVAVVGLGIARGGLPSRSMQVRWEYWRGAVEVVRESPWLGPGPANFADAYLRHRLPAAAETPKYPHDVFLDSAGQFGVPAAAILLALLVWALLAASRQSASVDVLPAAPPVRAPGVAVGWCVVVGVSALVARAVWGGLENPYFVLTDSVVPAFVLAVIFLAALWTGKQLGTAPGSSPWGRIALAAGLAGFALHNLITYSLFWPATATVFWVAAGATAGRADLRQRRLPRPLWAAIAAAAAAGTISAAVWLAGPVCERTAQMRLAQAAYAKGRAAESIRHIEMAMHEDSLDSLPAVDLAKTCLAVAAASPASEAQRLLDKAVWAAEAAWKRCPNSTSAVWLSRALGRQPGRRGQAIEWLQRAVGLDPMNLRLRMELASMLVLEGRAAAAAEQTRWIRQVDAARPADSDVRLSPAELRDLAVLDGRIGQLLGPAR